MNIKKALIYSIPFYTEQKLMYKKYHQSQHNIKSARAMEDSESLEFEDILNEAYESMLVESIKNGKSSSILPQSSNKCLYNDNKLHRYVNKWSIYRCLSYNAHATDYRESYEEAFKRLSKRNLMDEPINYPNLFLRSYEKNIIRVTYHLMRDGIILDIIYEYNNLFSRKLDADIRSAYFHKLKQWMNFELQKKNKVSINARIKTIKPTSIVSIYPKYKSYQNLFFEDLEQWKAHLTTKYNQLYIHGKDMGSCSTRQRLTPLHLSTHFVIVSLFSLISNFRQYFYSSYSSNRNLVYLRTKNSGYFSFLQNQILCDLITLLKMMQLNESWINHISELNRHALKDVYEFITEWKLSINTVGLLNKNTIRSNKVLTQLALLIKEAYDNPLEDLNVYISWLNKGLHSSIIETFFKQAGRKVIDYSREKNISRIDNYYPIVILNEHRQLDHSRSLFLNIIEFFILGRIYTFERVDQMASVLKSIKSKVAYDHIRLVMSIAKNLRYNNIEASDLLQEGMIGLIKAVERFQLDRGYQFSTYATWWVHQGLNRVTATQSGSMIPIPTHLQRKVHLIQSTSRDLSRQLKREPLIDEIARELKIPVYKIYQFLEASSLSKRLISLDQKVAAEDNRTFQYFLKTVTKKIPVNTTRLFSYIVRFLPPRDSTILKMRLGIVPYKRHTMEQVARIFSVNRDKIKIIEKSSMSDVKYNLSLFGRYEQIAPILSIHLSEKILSTSASKY